VFTHEVAAVVIRVGGNRYVDVVQRKTTADTSGTKVAVSHGEGALGQKKSTVSCGGNRREKGGIYTGSHQELESMAGSDGGTVSMMQTSTKRGRYWRKETTASSIPDGAEQFLAQG
jgi:hypothetical protein